METVDIVYVLPTLDASSLECSGDRSALSVVGRNDANLLVWVVALHDVNNRVRLFRVLWRKVSRRHP